MSALVALLVRRRRVAPVPPELQDAELEVRLTALHLAQARLEFENARQRLERIREVHRG